MNNQREREVSAKNLDKLCNELGNAHVDGDGAEVKDQKTPAIDRVECVSQSHILPWWFQGIDCEEHFNTMNGDSVDAGKACTASVPSNAIPQLISSTDGRSSVPGVLPRPGTETIVLGTIIGEHADAVTKIMPTADFVASQAAMTTPAMVNTDEMNRDDLKLRVRTQLEYYFSRENLSGDMYLRSQMDNDQYVPIRIVANFNLMKKLTTDMNLIVEALRESPYVQVDESGEKVRPLLKRTTLILRGVPKGTEKHEVEKLFDSPTCPRLISCECALNDSWYANFDSDEDAQKAYLYLRNEVKTFKGNPILARFKTAPISRVPNGYNGARQNVPPTAYPGNNNP
ncbi:La-related protein, partial [Trichinella zimbabwensis]